MSETKNKEAINTITTDSQQDVQNSTDLLKKPDEFLLEWQNQNNNTLNSVNGFWITPPYNKSKYYEFLSNFNNEDLFGIQSLLSQYTHPFTFQKKIQLGDLSDQNDITTNQSNVSNVSQYNDLNTKYQELFGSNYKTGSKLNDEQKSFLSDFYLNEKNLDLTQSTLLGAMGVPEEGFKGNLKFNKWYNELDENSKEIIRRDSDEYKQLQQDAIDYDKDTISNLGQTKTTAALSMAGNAIASVGKSSGNKAVEAIGTGIGSFGLGQQGLNMLKAGKGANNKTAKGAGIMSMVGAAADVVDVFLPDKDEYEGKKGDITEGMDTAYDAISNTAMMFGPVGMIVGGAMKAGNLLGDALNTIGGGTDGMCVCAGTKVFTADGNVVNVEDLKQEDGIIGWSEDVKQTIPQTIAVLIEPRQKQCVEIKLESGQKLRCSIDHPILSDISNNKESPKRWIFRQAGKLRKGDFVGLANSIDYWGSDVLDNAYKIGSVINKNTKKLPDNLFSLNRNSACELIAGLFDDCGKIFVDTKKDKVVLTFMMHNYYTIRKIKILLHKLGIFSYIKSGKSNNKLRIHDYNSIIEFYNNIYLRAENKQKLLDKAYKLALSKEDSEQSYFTGAKATKIVYIKSIGVQTVYNLQANDDHTYIANGIITHNTTADAILGSSFFNLTPIGLINGFGGSKTQSFTKDEEAFETVGGSYTGSEKKADKALEHANKKYGLISRHKGNSWNDAITEAKRQQDLISDISKDVQNRTDAMDYMGNMYANAYQTELAGGYDQTDGIHIGKQGMKISLDKGKKWLSRYKNGEIVISKEITPIDNRQEMYKQGGEIKMPDMHFNIIEIKSVDNRQEKFKQGGEIKAYGPAEAFTEIKPITFLNEKYKNAVEIKPFEPDKDMLDKFKKGGIVIEKQPELSDYEKIINKVLKNQKEKPNFITRMDQPYLRVIDYTDDQGNEIQGAHYIATRQGDNGVYVYSRIQKAGKGKKLRFLNDDEAFGKALRMKDYLLLPNYDDVDIVRNHYKEIFDKYDDPQIFIFDIPQDIVALKKGGVIEENVEVRPLADIGGDNNVIPEGALHARLNHIGDEDLTKKGIPVVSNNGQQQAEIENSEIILRLAVTQRLEDLQKRYEKAENDDDKDRLAIEAGKLLVEEILYNTIDNTKNLL